MKVWPIWRNDTGLLRGFEVSSLAIILRPYIRLLRKTPGVTDVRRQLRNDDRIAFKFMGHEAVVYEWFGDSSRYWIGLQNPDANPGADIWPLLSAFASHRGALSASSLATFLDPTDTNLEFEYLVRPFLAKHLDIRREWTTVRSYWSGGRTILVCKNGEENFVSVNLTGSQIGVLSPSVDQDFECFGRGRTSMQVAQEAFSLFLEQLGITTYS